MSAVLTVLMCPVLSARSAHVLMRTIVAQADAGRREMRTSASPSLSALRSACDRSSAGSASRPASYAACTRQASSPPAHFKSCVQSPALLSRAARLGCVPALTRCYVPGQLTTLTTASTGRDHDIWTPHGAVAVL